MDIGDMGRIGGPDMAGMIPGTIHITAGTILGIMTGTAGMAGMIPGTIHITAGIIPDIMVIGGLVAEHTTLIMAIPEEVALHIMGL